MKTQVIQLDPHDDVLSIRDKLGWGRVGRALLVWPTSRKLQSPSHLPQSRLDLALLQHAARSLGLQLAIVTNDPEASFNARSLGIPVFGSIRRAQTARWRTIYRQPWRRRSPSSKRPPAPLRHLQTQPKHPAWHLLGRGVSFTLAILAFLTVALALIPEAHITLSPAIQNQEVVLTVSASPAVSAISLAGSVPLHTQSLVVEGSGVLTTTGTAEVPIGQATGEVRFTNLSSHSLSIPAGLVVCTEDEAQCFSVAREGRVRAGPGTTITLAVTALNPGAESNVRAFAIRRIRGPLSFLLAVSNPQAMRHGANVTLPAPTADDQRRLHDQMLEQLRQSALDQLKANLNSGDVLLGNLVLTRTLEESYSPAEGQPATQLSLTLRLQFEAQVATAADLRQLAQMVLDARLPEGYRPLADTLSIENLDAPVATGQTFRWQMRAQRDLRATLPQAEVADAIRGLTPLEAGRRISAWALSTPPRVVLSPEWWPRLPWVAFRIHIEEP